MKNTNQIFRYKYKKVKVRLLIEPNGYEEDVDNIEEFITKMKVKIEYVIRASNTVGLPLEEVVYEEGNILASTSVNEVTFNELVILRQVGLVAVYAVNDPSHFLELGKIHLKFAGFYDVKGSDEIAQDDCKMEREL